MDASQVKQQKAYLCCLKVYFPLADNGAPFSPTFSPFSAWLCGNTPAEEIAYHFCAQILLEGSEDVEVQLEV